MRRRTKSLIKTYFLLLPIVWIHGYYAGSPSRFEPVDNTGTDSIVVIVGHPDGNHWVELRGPARYETLDLFGEPME